MTTTRFRGAQRYLHELRNGEVEHPQAEPRTRDPSNEHPGCGGLVRYPEGGQARHKEGPLQDKQSEIYFRDGILLSDEIGEQTDRKM